MINLNEIAFIDEYGFDFNTGESLIRFDVVAYNPDTKQINLLFKYPSYIPKIKPKCLFHSSVYLQYTYKQNFLFVLSLFGIGGKLCLPPM